MRGPLPQEEFDHIFSRDPRLTVELVIASDDRGVLLALRDFGPCQGPWHLPGGTARFGETLVDAVERVAQDEVGLTVSIGQLLGYIEYPSNYDHGLDSPAGLAFRADVVGDLPDEHDPRADPAWFTVLPDNMHDEQGVPRSPSGHHPGITTARTCLSLYGASGLQAERVVETLTKEARRDALATELADEAQARARGAGRADMSPLPLA